MVLLYLIAFRIANAFLLQTFFQPDEYFQSLEPAWRIAFGPGSGARITWEWREHLRSSIHPYIFATVYQAASSLATVTGVNDHIRAELLLAAPKVTQAVFAALMDWYIWGLARRHSSKGSDVNQAALYMTVLSPWQWFCSTRTLMNSLESTLTAATLHYWPWELFSGNQGVRKHSEVVKRLRTSLCLAAFTSILRAPNLIIWVTLAAACTIHAVSREGKGAVSKIVLLLREAVICGLVAIGVTAMADRQYYGQWTLPPLKFVQFNVVQSLAVFYGRNRPDYYLTEGLPLLLTTALPFAVVAIFNTLRGSTKARQVQPPVADRSTALYDISSVAIICTTVTTLSLIPHKEVRFLYPLLPVLTVLAARQVARFFTPFPNPTQSYKRVLLYGIAALNVAFAGYISLVHQRGVIDVTHYLRQEYEQHYLLPNVQGLKHGEVEGRPMTVAFLMPCHSTPWRSHLIHPGIHAWALSCEPPLNMSVQQRETYLDEADQFFADPDYWLRRNIVAGDEADSQAGSNREKGVVEVELGKRDWPGYVVFFEQLEPVIRAWTTGAGRQYGECWRGFNSHFHDDWRRKGDVIVWCLQERANA